MRITVVGCSGLVPGPASPASCYLVEADDADGRTWRVVLDLGAGALGALQRFCDPRDVDVVALSHLHADHCADLAALHVYLGHHPDGPGATTVVGPFGTAGRIAQLRGTDEPSGRLDVAVWQADRGLSVGPMTLHAFPVEHPVPAYAIRVEGPSARAARSRAVVAYSGDTGACEGLIEAARGADLFLCEASFIEEPISGRTARGNVNRDGANSGSANGGGANPERLHLTGAEAGRAGSAARVDRLMLTHIPPWHDPNTVLAEAAREFAGALELARPGQHLEV